MTFASTWISDQPVSVVLTALAVVVLEGIDLVGEES